MTATTRATKTTLYFKDLPKRLREQYSWLDRDAKKHPLIWDGDVLRFKPNPCVDFLTQADTGVRYLNEMWIAALREKWAWKEIRQFYRMMGYSLCGYGEVFDTDERMS